MGYEEREMKLTAMAVLFLSVNDARISVPCASCNILLTLCRSDMWAVTDVFAAACYIAPAVCRSGQR